MNRFVGLGMAVLLVACDGSLPPDPGEERPPAPPINAIQAVGFSDSYHLPPDEAPLLEVYPEFAFTRPPIRDQLEVHQARVIDLIWGVSGSIASIFSVLGPGDFGNSHCEVTYYCLEEIQRSLIIAPELGPVFVLLRPFDWTALGDNLELFDINAENYPFLLEDVLDRIPPEHVFTPNQLQGRHDSIREALEVEGWPSYDVLRGKMIFILVADEETRTAYLDGHNFHDRDTDDLAAFVATDDPTDDFAAFFSVPGDNPGRIRQLSEAGFIVHSSVTPENFGDAAAAGAHLFTTFELAELDLPALPASCNPVSAPDVCVPEMFEAPGVDPGAP